MDYQKKEKRIGIDWGIDLVVDWVEGVSWNKHVSPQRSLSFYWKIDIFIKKITRSKYKQGMCMHVWIAHVKINNMHLENRLYFRLT